MRLNRPMSDGAEYFLAGQSPPQAGRSRGGERSGPRRAGRESVRPARSTAEGGRRGNGARKWPAAPFDLRLRRYGYGRLRAADRRMPSQASPQGRKSADDSQAGPLPSRPGRVGTTQAGFSFVVRVNDFAPGLGVVVFDCFKRGNIDDNFVPAGGEAFHFRYMVMAMPSQSRICASSIFRRLAHS